MSAARLCMGCMADRGGAATCVRCGYVDGTAATSPLHLAPGSSLQDGQYVIGKVLGHGGFGITYIGWDTNLERKLAVKEYFPSGVALRTGNGNEVAPFSGQQEKDYQYGLQQYLEEARLVARFNHHPNILAVLNFFRENGTAYIVMEYLEGRTLDRYLDQMGGRLDFEEAVTLLEPVMCALEEVHSANILHRDVSPDNIHLGLSRQVKLLDFGAARIALSERSRNLSVILKEGYAPPEQYRSKGNQGPWTDVYALAATLYRTVTGFLPPPALDRMTDDELKPLSHFCVSVSEELDRVIQKALAFNSQDRYQTMAEFRQAITQPNLLLQRMAAPAVTVAIPGRPSTRNPSSGSFPESGAPVVFPPPTGPAFPEPPPPGLLPPWLWSVIGAGVVVLGVIGMISYLRPSAPVNVAQQLPPSSAATVASAPAPAQLDVAKEVQKAAPLPPGATPQPVSVPSRSKALMEQAVTASPERAVDLLRQAIQADPNDPDPHDLLAQTLLYKMGKPVEAAEQYRYAIQLGGTATFHVRHLSHDEDGRSVGEGELRIKANGVTYADKASKHTFSTPRTNVAPLRRVRLKKLAPGAVPVELNSGERYIFVGTSSQRAVEGDMISRLLE